MIICNAFLPHLSNTVAANFHSSAIFSSLSSLRMRFVTNVISLNSAAISLRCYKSYHKKIVFYKLLYTQFCLINYFWASLIIEISLLKSVEEFLFSFTSLSTLKDLISNDIKQYWSKSAYFIYGSINFSVSVIGSNFWLFRKLLSKTILSGSFHSKKFRQKPKKNPSHLKQNR